MTRERTAAPSRVRDGVGAALPFAVAVGLFGISFGVLADAEAGLGPAAAILMSITTFGGSASSRPRRSWRRAASRSRPSAPRCC